MVTVTKKTVTITNRNEDAGRCLCIIPQTLNGFKDEVLVAIMPVFIPNLTFTNHKHARETSLFPYSEDWKVKICDDEHTDP